MPLAQEELLLLLEEQICVRVLGEACVALVAERILAELQRLLRTAVDCADLQRRALRHHLARRAGPKPLHPHFVFEKIVRRIQRAAHGNLTHFDHFGVGGIAIAAQKIESAANGLDDMLLVRQLPDRQSRRHRGLRRAHIDVRRISGGIQLVLAHDLRRLAERLFEVIRQLFGGIFLHAVGRCRQDNVGLVRASFEKDYLRLFCGNGARRTEQCDR